MKRIKSNLYKSEIDEKNYRLLFEAEHKSLKTFKDGRGKFGRILGELWFNDAYESTYHNINQLLVDNQGNIISVDNNSKWKCIRIFSTHKRYITCCLSH